MGLTQLRGFSGDAEILGAVREVDYHEVHGLTIRGVTLTEAYELLKALSSGKVSQVESLPPTMVHLHTANGAAPVKAAEERPQRTIKDDVEAMNDPPPKARKSSPNPEPKPGTFKLDPENPPPELVNAKRMINVIDFFTERGVKDIDTMATECEKIKTKIDILRRVPSIRDRLASTQAAHSKDA